MANAAVASASIPTVFPAYVWEGKGVFIDGGTYNNIELDAMINQCLEVVDDISKIVADVLICGPENYVAPESEVSTSIPNFMRARSMHSSYNSGNSLQYFMEAYPDV